MADIDYVAMNKANKGLIVIFIIVIILINFLLIVKTARKGGFIYNPRSLTLVSLAIGDIFLALFSLVVWARLYYGEIFELSCSTLKSAFVYMFFLIHFVYSIGLIVLALELVIRFRKLVTITNTSINIVKSLVCSAVPWFLGLLIVLPVTMADTEQYTLSQTHFYCIIATTKRFITMFGVCVVLPVCLALIVTITLMCIRLLPVHYTSQVVGFQVPTQGVIIATHNTTQQYHTSGVSHTQQIPTAPPTYTFHNNQNSKPEGSALSTTGPQYPPPQYPAHYLPQQYPVQQYPPPQYPVQQYPLPQYAVQQYPPPHYTPQLQIIQPNVASGPVYAVDSQTPDVLNFQNEVKEKRKLLVVSIALFLCTMPLAVFIMGSQDSNQSRYNRSSIDDAVESAFLWLSLFRSIVTPIIWSGCSRK